MEEAIEGQIAALREKRIKQKKEELKMLQNENGTRMEQLLRVQVALSLCIIISLQLGKNQKLDS